MLARSKPVIRWLTTLAMVIVGVLHFAEPNGFLAIMPKSLPAPLALIYFSGVCEILGGIGLQLPKVRFAAAIGLIALYLAVFPANINMAVNHLQLDPNHPIPDWAAWARLPFQALFIVNAWWLRR